MVPSIPKHTDQNGNPCFLISEKSIQLITSLNKALKKELDIVEKLKEEYKKQNKDWENRHKEISGNFVKVCQRNRKLLETIDKERKLYADIIGQLTENIAELKTENDSLKEKANQLFPSTPDEANSSLESVRSSSDSERK